MPRVRVFKCQKGVANDKTNISKNMYTKYRLEMRVLFKTYLRLSVFDPSFEAATSICFDIEFLVVPHCSSLRLPRKLTANTPL